MLRTANEKITYEEYLILYTDMGFIEYVLRCCRRQIHCIVSVILSTLSILHH
jgi:hypothetical protein